MSTTTDLVIAEDHGAIVPVSTGAVEHAEGHSHPGPRQYVIIAVILVVITAIEVGMSYLEGDVDSNVLIAMLLGAAAIKFVLVVAWFMHLKTDSKILRRFFIMGLVGAILLFTVIFLTLHGMQNSYNFPTR